MNLLIFPQYPYPANHAVVNTVYESMLPERGHAVHMIRPKVGITALESVAPPWPNGSMVVYPDEPTAGRISNIFRSIRCARWVAAAVRQLRHVPVDAIIVRNDLVSARVAAREARRRGIPLIYQLSSPDAEFTISRGRETPGLAGLYLRIRGWLGVMARRRVCRESAAVLAISNAMRSHLITNDHVDAGKVFAFPMGVLNAPPPSADEVESLRQRLQLPRGRTVVFSGVLDPVREPGFMLDVFDLVRVKLSDAVFLVLTYQTDERRRQFEAEALRRGADVRVIGPVPFRDVATYLRCADVAISPYRPMLEHKVASPTKSIEAMNAGLPVVGSCEVDEHADVLESSGGGVSVPWDRRQFANAIEALLQDPQRRHRMGEHGRAWTLEHRTYAHLTEYLERIVAASSHPAARRALPHEP